MNLLQRASGANTNIMGSKVDRVSSCGVNNSQAECKINAVNGFGKLNMDLSAGFSNALHFGICRSDHFKFPPPRPPPGTTFLFIYFNIQ